jgi:hypothetical protein
MNILRTLIRHVVVAVRFCLLMMALSGCTILFQKSSTVLIREPGHYFYSPPIPTEQVAREYWEYATIAGLAYPNSELPDQTACATANIPVPGKKEAVSENMSSEELQKLASDKFSAIFTALVDLGWSQWQDFPDKGLYDRMAKLDLYVNVWERKTGDRTTVVVAFKGTNPESLEDWNANLRWVTRFFPGNYDQYDEVMDDFGPAFAKAYKAHVPGARDDGRDVIYAAGHSLGGGLAQEFAYALPPSDSYNPRGEYVPRISKVYAFDPSPVTGYYSVPADIRTVNERGTPNEKMGMEIGRILEKGEILSYLRYVVALVYFPSAEDPSIEGVRFNLFPSLSPITSHSIDELSCKLFEAATSTGKPPAHYDPEIAEGRAAPSN